MRAIKRFNILGIYFLPCLLVMSAVLYSYQQRTIKVTDQLKLKAGKINEAHPCAANASAIGSAESDNQVETAGADGATVDGGDDAEGKNAPISTEEKLVQHFKRLLADCEVIDKVLSEIEADIQSIWVRKSLIICMLVTFPFLVLGFQLAFSKEINLTLDERMRCAASGWFMRLMMSGAMAFGGLYVLNPRGRGATTVQEYLRTGDVFADTTLPLIFDTSTSLSPIVSGILGWYLYLMFYFIRKANYHDSKSHRVYQLLFAKLLFTLGIGMVFKVLIKEASPEVVMFFVGFFPLSAASIIRERGTKVLKGGVKETGALSELPGISQWQLMRLEEEGIDSISTLSSCNLTELQKQLPSILDYLVSFWIDIAQLRTILGNAHYEELKGLCQTASGYLAQAHTEKFQAAIIDKGLPPVFETTLLLARTYGDNLISRQLPMSDRAEPDLARD